MTQIDAADAIGITQSAISLWETGRAYPTGERLKVVADVYSCTIDELFQEHTEEVK